MAHRYKPPIPAAIRRCDSYTEADMEDWIYQYWDRDDELLYIGISNNAAKRAMGHRSRSKWWRFVAGGSAVRVPAARSERIERDMIQDMRPLFNITHAYNNSVELIEYCARREAWEIVDDELDLMRYGGEAHLIEEAA